ncbi:MAG: alpha/beta hydrolase [Candidatus Helarchaeota archaeon]
MQMNNFSEKRLKINVREEIDLDASFFQNIHDANIKTPLIILLHGWNNDKRELNYLIPSLIRNHFKILTYSHRGHGKSGGKRNLRSMYNDIHEVIEYSINNFEYIDVEKINIIGQSLGAGISLTEAYKNNKVKRIIALNPFFNPQNALKQNRNILIKFYLWVTRFRINDEINQFIAPEYSLKRDSSNENRIYLILSKKDSYIPFSEKQKLLDFLDLPKENIKIFNNGGHTFKRLQDEVTKQINTWLNKI